MNALYGAILCTKATSHAFFVINTRKIILDLHRIRGADLLALGASDAGIRASTARIGSLVLIIAHHDRCGISRHERDNRAGTCFCAKTATYAKLCINVRNAVLDAYRAYGTDRRALAESQASVSTGTGAAVYHRCRAAGRIALILRLVRGRLAVAVAMNERNATLLCLCFDSKHLSKRTCGVLTARNAKIDNVTISA